MVDSNVVTKTSCVFKIEASVIGCNNSGIASISLIIPWYRCLAPGLPSAIIFFKTIINGSRDSSPLNPSYKFETVDMLVIYYQKLSCLTSKMIRSCKLLKQALRQIIKLSSCNG